MSHRLERVAHEIRTRLARIIDQQVSDPRLRELSITGVELSADRGFARIFYRVLGDQDRSSVDAALDRAVPFIRRQLGQGLRLRRVPVLEFRFDDSLDRAARVEKILQEIEEESSDRRTVGD